MTSFDLTIPGPVGFDAARASFRQLPAGTPLHRIHDGRFGSVEFNGTALGNARFSPIRRPDGAIIPTIYAAQSFECAISETILRCPDQEMFDQATGRANTVVERPHKWRASVHSSLDTTRDLRLVDLTGRGQRQLGINRNALLAGPTGTYGATRAWAEAIHAGTPDADGLFYTSHQYGDEFAIMIFGDRAPDALRGAAQPRRVADRDCDREIRMLANAFGITYEDL
nr:RES family NAD+ phosphorylase [Paracoccus saliphilus]